MYKCNQLILNRHKGNIIVFLQVESFFKDINVGSGQRALAQTLETIRLNIQWHGHNLEDVSHWLNRHILEVKTKDEVIPK